MTTLEPDEKLILAGAACRVTRWNLYMGALLLTDKRLIFEAPWRAGERGLMTVGHADYSLPIQSFSNPRPSSRFPAFYYGLLWMIFLFRPQLRANFAVTSEGKDYHFRVRDPQAWIRGVESARQAAGRSW